jgi:tetratricopeptide (TPR) repeat protein
MKFLKTVSTLAFVLLLAASAAAQSRGNLRLTGRVLDEAGKPVPDAQVTATRRGDATAEKFNAKTNDKGEYTINNLLAGTWIVRGEKEGVGANEVDATLADGARTTTVDITIAPPKADPNAELQAGHQQGIKLWQEGKPAEARKIYIDLLAKYPQVYQLNVPLANIYADEKNFEKAVEHMKIAVDKEPANVEWKIVYAELLMEAGRRDEAGTLLEAIDLTQVKEHRAFTNLAINYINVGKEPEATRAVDLLTKLIAQFPSDPALHYYRAKAYIVATKLPEAKADLEKFVAAAPPNAPQMADAQKLLEQLNKKQ